LKKMYNDEDAHSRLFKKSDAGLVPAQPGTLLVLAEEPQPRPGDPDYTIGLKVQEIVICLKYLAMHAIEGDHLTLARDALTAAEWVNDLGISEVEDDPWTGL
jgi:hypothetical protein